MLMTDMDNESEDDKNRVTLMTVHSSKGLEYDYINIVGLEENLFPSQRAKDSGDIEEERRLFYVAITRAKVAATISYAESRFKWGTMEFSKPSCFLSEIDPQYLDIADSDNNQKDTRRPQLRDGANSLQRDSGAAINELRKRFDYRQQQGKSGSSTYGGARSEKAAVPPPPRPVSTEGMRRVGVRQMDDNAASTSSAPCRFSVGDRVEHPRFGAGVIKAIETLSTDHKLIVVFGDQDEKTLLSKFAKLTKL